MKGSAVPTDTRAGARTFRLDELAELAWAGTLRVPHFQRDFRWTRSDVLQLFDSIHRGYPIGSLLLWERAAPAQEVRLGYLQMDAPATDRALWVVDGQQRVTSLANVLHPDGHHDPRFAVGYDLPSDQIVPLPAIPSASIIPIPVIFDLTEVLTWFADHPEVSEWRDAAFRLARDLRQFSIPAYQVVQDDVTVLQNIFDRMNNSGKRLTRAEVFSALTAGTDGQAPQQLTIQRVAEEIEARLGFGQIDDDTVLRCILARRGPDIQREIRNEFDPDRAGRVDFPGESQDEAYRQGRDALAQAVEFVIGSGIPHFSMLPYRYLLIVLTRFFGLHQELTPAQERLLKRWLWRAAFAGPSIDKGSTTGVTRSFAGRIDWGPVEESLRGLLELVGTTLPTLPDLSRFNTNHAATKIVLCSWWRLHPRNCSTAEPFTREELAEAIGDGNTAAPAVQVAFRRSALDPAVRDWAANRLLMPIIPDGALEAVSAITQPPLTISSDDWRHILASYGIEGEALARLDAGDHTGFIHARHAVLAARLDEFSATQCEWDYEDIGDLGLLDLDEEFSGADQT